MFTRVVELTTKSGKNRRDYGGEKSRTPGETIDGFPTDFNHFPECLGSGENRLNDDISPE